MDKNVLVVDDSLLFASLLSKIVNSIDGYNVISEARNVYEATTLIERERPDMILLDVEMAGMNGIHFLRKLIPQYPVPVIICTSHSAFALKALSAGAADFVVKPENFSGGFEKFSSAVTAAVKNAGNLREVTCEGRAYRLKKTDTKKTGCDELIVIGGSAGSTEALPKLLKKLPPDMPPIAAALHMPEGYTNIFAKRLDSELPFEVFEAENAMRLHSGMVVVAKGSKHLRLYSSENGIFTGVSSGEKISGHCPSVDALFMSAAEMNVKKIIAVLLTGMGTDGARGLLKLRRAGAYTIGQDEASSLVYGMPKAAYEMGAVCEQCSLDRIADSIKKKLEEW